MLSVLVSALGAIDAVVLKTGKGPTDILFRDKAAVQKILVEDDLVKGPVYEMIRPRPDVTSLITETDKTLYKQKV